MELPKRYDPQSVEPEKYEYWENEGYFRANVNRDREPFSMVIPPPNVTSELHVGHALQFTLHDIVIRYRRMEGREACWFPGMDHAGIATQNVVEKQLHEEGLTRHDLGREKFQERVWEWKEEYGGKIKDQLKALGCSPDWSRERFTLDEGLSEAVKEAFVRLYEEGFIYRDKYIINWCPRCNTALSDIEVEHEEEQGRLYWINYPLKGSDEHLTIATTRPETMLGDTGIAIHPQDPRADQLVGKTAILPLVERELPIVSDQAIDPEFGTGLLKVTPAHDPTDFDIGDRHGLDSISVLDRDGNIDFEGKYNGLSREEGREQVVEDLKSEGYLKKTESYTHSVGHCQRCETTIEPTISTQWFVEMEDLAQPAIEAVREDTVKLIPDRWKKVYFEWMENIQDWCISRQLWWGHRIPAWYCQECEEVIVARSEPDNCPSCKSSELKQDSDVLDTWFSSALWPFSVMGWPEETEDLGYFFPTNLLITGFDIIFFWVARMIIMSTHFMGEIPFEEVLLTPLVLDESGEKMSSSKGNILDPLDLRDQYGADAVRFTMASSTTKGRGMKLSEDEIKDSRNFLNKIWNAARFALTNLGEEVPALEEDELKLEDRWILSRYHRALERVQEDLNRYEFKDATKAIYDFVWKDFCDWYLEIIKPRLYSSNGDTQAEAVLYRLLQDTLRLLHPFIPFLTEEIWDKMHPDGEGLIIQSFPEVRDNLIQEETENKFHILQDLVAAVRSVRADMNIPDGEQIEAYIKTGKNHIGESIEQNKSYFEELAGVEKVEVTGPDGEHPTQSARRVLEDAEVLVPLGDVINIPEERERIQGELSEVEEDLQNTLRKLNDEEFLTKAPEEIVEKEKKKKEEFQAKRSRLARNLEALEEK